MYIYIKEQLKASSSSKQRLNSFYQCNDQWSRDSFEQRFLKKNSKNMNINNVIKCITLNGWNKKCLYKKCLIVINLTVS